MKTSVQKNVLLFAFLLIIALGCKTHKKNETLTIDKVKEAAANGDKKLMESDIIIEGYFWNETVPLLITDLKLLDINTPLPEQKFILLSGPGIEKILVDEKFSGAYIRITGKVRAVTNKKTGIMEIDVICTEPPLFLKPRIKDVLIPFKFNFCQLNPRICEFQNIFPFKTKYAILYSGGLNIVNAHRRYWNDLQFMYFTLKNKYGYTDENIIVIYKNGSPEDLSMPVDYAATTNGLRNAIDFLKSKITFKDDLFVFVTNHGAGYHRGAGHQGIATAGNRGGTADANSDEIDAQMIDENIFYYGQSNNNLLDDDFGSMLNELERKRMIAVMEPCFSGGLLHDLRGVKSVVISASDEFQFSYAGASSNGVSYDMFSYYFTEALNQANPSGVALATNPDTNGDNKVSILEAFLYAKSKDTANETPMLEDTGDGVGTNTPAAAAGDGLFSSTTFL